MPEIRKLSFDTDETIGQRLHEASLEMLPEELLKNDSVRWIVQYDAVWARSGNDYNNEFESYGIASLVGESVSSALQRRLPFYFAALFHIGRMRNVARNGLENIEALQSERNWKVSIANFERLSRRREGLATSRSPNVQKILRRMCNVGGDRFKDDLRKAEDWWRLWLNEVGALKHTVDRLEEVWRRTERNFRRRGGSSSEFAEASEFASAALSVCVACSTQSRLAGEMVGAGVKIKAADVTTSADQFSLLELIPVTLMAISCTPGWSHLPSELHHLAEQWFWNERARRIQPQVDIALDALRAKYGTKSPFDDYLPGRKIATSELRTLMQEHTLPGNDPSPWLAAWKRSLGDPLNLNSYSPLFPPRELEGEEIESAARAVDSTLKTHIADSFPPLGTWGRFLQTIYEKYCLREFGKGAGGANEKAGKTFSVWSVERFCEYVRAVTRKVNELGYVLSAPSNERLRILLEKTTKGESVWGEGDW